MLDRVNVEQILVKELMEDSPDYIFIKGRQSRFVVTNKAHSRLLLGLENPQDAVGKTDFDLFPGKREDANRFFAEEQAFMETGQPVIHLNGWLQEQQPEKWSVYPKASCQ